MLGNGVSAALGFGVLALLTRTLQPESFGTLAEMINVIDFGLAVVDSLLFTGVVVTASRYLKNNPDRSAMALKVGFILRLAIVLAIGGAGWLLAPQFSRQILGTDDWSSEVRSVFFALGLLTLYGFFLSVLQVRQKYIWLGLATNYKNATRLAFVVALVVIGQLTVSTAATALLSGAAVALALVAATVGFDFLRVPGFDRSVLVEVFSINKWMALAALGLLGARIDIVILGRWSTADQVGYYAAALQLCLIITLISTALVTTLLPRTAQLTNSIEMRQHFRSSLPFLPAGPLGFLLVFAVSDWLIPIALGAAYSGVVGPFDLLMASAMITLVTNPILMLFFPLNLVPTYAVITLIQLVLRIGANLVIVPAYGAAGAAGVDLLVKLVTVPVAMLLIHHAIASRLASETSGHGAAAPQIAS